jgi:hypothetical protein
MRLFWPKKTGRERRSDAEISGNFPVFSLFSNESIAKTSSHRTVSSAIHFIIYINGLLQQRIVGEHRGLGESLASVARRKTAANGHFRCISAPGLGDALLNLRLGDAFEPETGSTISETRFEASHQYAARGVLQCRNAEEPSGRRVDVDRRSGNFATIPMEISFEEKCQFTTARVDRLMALRGFHRIGRSSALTRS